MGRETETGNWGYVAAGNAEWTNALLWSLLCPPNILNHGSVQKASAFVCDVLALSLAKLCLIPT